MDDRWLDQLESGRQAFALANNLEASLWRGRQLADDETRGLVRACEAGLAAFADGGTTLVTCFDRTRKYQLFVHYDGGRLKPGRAWSWSWQEAFTQVVFAVELVLDHGWAPDQVALEVDHLDVGAGPNPRRSPLILCEAKLTDQGPQGLQAMLSVFNELAGGSSAGVAAGVRANAVPKYAALARLRPSVFVGVAPGVRHAFDCTYSSGRPQLSRASGSLALSALANKPQSES